MRRTGIAFLAGALATAVILLSGGAALAEEKEQCFLQAKNLAYPLRLLSEWGDRKLKTLCLFLKNRDFVAASELMRKEGILRTGKTENRVHLVPPSLALSNPLLINIVKKHYQFFRFPGSVVIYYNAKSAIYCKP